MHQKYGVLKNGLNQKHFTLKPVNMLSVFDQVQLQTTFFAELGRVSLQCQRHINILNFFAPLSSLDSKRYASKAFIMLTKDADYGHTTGYLMLETFEHAMKYMNPILVQSLKLKSLSTVS